MLRSKSTRSEGDPMILIKRRKLTKNRLTPIDEKMLQSYNSKQKPKAKLQDSVDSSTSNKEDKEHKPLIKHPVSAKFGKMVPPIDHERSKKKLIDLTHNTFKINKTS